MSKQVDERVVSMQFDNSHFEKNVQTTMSTLDKLKQKLNLQGASKGLEDVNTAAKKVDMSGISNGIETVRSKFSALEVMGVTALANITNSAVNAGKNLVKAFTIDPIKTGFQEYETQINAVQTILANTQSKGTTLKDVNGALDELNAYADKTIYNFTEMTRNIGTFTAAGVDLDTSVSAIKGIANLAAVSGSNSQQASTAMYQLSQALSSGTVKLQDWNSVVNAGMGGQVFQDALKETARVHGIKIDQMIKKEGSFRETLQKGWLSSKILTETLAKFTGDLSEQQLKSMGYTDNQIKEIMKLGKTANDAATKVKTFTQLMDTLKEAAQSGWTQTWEILVGDFEEAKSLWTGVSDTLSEMINKSSEARNNMLEGWSKGGGRTMAIEALKNTFEGLMNIIKPIKEALAEVFPPITSEQLLKITERIRDLAAKFKEFTEKYAPKIKSTFKGLFSIIKVGVTVIKAIISGVAQLIGKITGLSGGILGVTGSLGEWISGIAKSVTETNIFGKAINAIVDFLGKAIDKIKEFGSYIKGKFKAPGFETFSKILTTIWETIKKVGMAIIKVASSIGKAFGNAFRNGDIKSFLDIVNGGIITSILLSLKKWIKGFKEFAGSGKDILGGIKGVLDEVGNSLQAWQQNIKAGTLQKIAISIGILAAALWVLSGIDPDKLGSALGAITVLFMELIGALKAFDKLGIASKGAGKSAMLMIGMSIAVLILASALKKLADLDWNGIGKGVTGVAGLIGSLTASMIAISKFAKTSESVFKVSKKGLFSSKSKTQFISIGLAMIAMAAAIKILSSACKDLGTMNWKELGKGLTGVVGLMGAAVGAMIALSKFAGSSKKLEFTKNGIFSSKNKNQFISIGLTMIAIAAAMKIMASASKDFASMSWGGLGKAGAAIGGILALVVGFNKLCDFVKMDTKETSWSLLVISVAMEIFADVCQKFGGMTWPDLGKAEAAIGGILALASGFMLLTGLAKNMKGAVFSLLIISIAMEIFANVCQKFGQMDWGALGKAGAAIGGILLLVAGFTLLSGLAPHVMLSAWSLLIMAAALAIITPILKTLGEMSWGEIVKGLVAITGAFAIIGVAGLVLGPIVPIILALSGAIALFGLGCLSAGVGIAAFAAGLMALSTLTASSAAAIVAAIYIIVVGILEMIPAIVNALTDAIVALCQVFIQSIPAICEAIKVLIVELTKVLVECIPVLADGALKLIVGLLNMLVQYAPQLVNGLVDLIIALINALALRIPDLIESLVNFLVALFKGIISNIGPLIDSITGLIKQLCDSIAEILGSIGEVIKDFGEAIKTSLDGVAGVFDSAFGGVADVINSVGDTIKKFLDGISNVIDSVGEAALNAGTGFENLAKGVKTITKLNLIDMAASMAAVASGIGKIASHSDKLAETGKSMREIANGTNISSLAFNTMATGIAAAIKGLSSIGPIASNSMAVLKSSCANAARNMYSSFYNAGSYVAQGFANGIKDNRYKAEAQARIMAQNAATAAEKALKINSPSKVFRAIAYSIPEGFAQGIDRKSWMVTDSAESMSESAINGTKKAISMIADSINNGVDSQPTIRPVLDLSDIENGASTINGMFTSRTLKLNADSVGTISESMNKLQNGRNSDNVVSAINGLRKDISDMPRNTYSINGITYDDGSNVSDAVKTLVRAARIERRT